AVTVTLLSTIPGTSVKSSRYDSSRRNVRLRVETANPKPLTERRYEPNASPVSANLPLASVVVFVTPPLPRFSICTSALTMTSPTESRTVPLTLAPGACAEQTATPQSSTSTHTRNFKADNPRPSIVETFEFDRESADRMAAAACH